jgi:hypothetical protein
MTLSIMAECCSAVCVTNKPFILSVNMLSVVMFIVIMLSVVVPKRNPNLLTLAKLSPK